MSLRKRNVLTLWDPGGDIVTTAIVSVGGHWFRPQIIGTDSDISSNVGANIPTDAWMVFDTESADACCIQIGTEIATVTGGLTCTDAFCRIQAFGLPFTAAAPHDQPPAVEATLVAGENNLGGHTPLTIRTAGTDGLVGAFTNSATNCFDDLIMLSDGTAVAVGDTSLITFWLAHPNLNDAVGATGFANNRPPRISGIVRVWLAIELVPTLGSSVTAMTLTAGSRIHAILFDEYVKSVPYKLGTREDLKTNIPAV